MRVHGAVGIGSGFGPSLTHGGRKVVLCGGWPPAPGIFAQRLLSWLPAKPIPLHCSFEGPLATRISRFADTGVRQIGSSVVVSRARARATRSPRDTIVLRRRSSRGRARCATDALLDRRPGDRGGNLRVWARSGATHFPSSEIESVCRCLLESGFDGRIARGGSFEKARPRRSQERRMANNKRDAEHRVASNDDGFGIDDFCASPGKIVALDRATGRSRGLHLPNRMIFPSA